MELFTRKDLISPDPVKYASPSHLLKVLELILSISVLCDNKEHLINDIIMNLEEEVQAELMSIM